MKTRWIALWLFGLCAATGGAQAGVSLLAKADLVKVLTTSPPCCVIDARSEEARKARPIKEALEWLPGLKINPTATVVVVADADARAMAVARSIDKTHPRKVIVAVKGGFPVWEAILIDQEKGREHSVQGSTSFVIPKNTCEQGTPLQTLPRGRN
jgi:hypothetical protein